MKNVHYPLLFIFVMCFISCKEDNDKNETVPTDIQFIKTYGSDGQDYAKSGIIHDHSLFLVGTTKSFNEPNGNHYLLHVDTTGAVIFEKNYGGNGAEDGIRLFSTSDNHLILLGTTESTGNGKKDIHVIKLDLLGNIIWEKTFGGAQDDTPASIIETASGELCIAGTTESFGGGLRDIYMIWLDLNGQLIREVFHGSTDFDGSSELVEVDSNNLLVFGYTRNYGATSRDFYLLKTNAQGDSLWSQRYGGVEYEESQALLKTAEGDFVLHGHSAEKDPNHNMYTLKVDATGNILWENHLGGAMHDGGEAALINTNGDYVVVGRSMSHSEGKRDIIMATIAPNGTVLQFDVIDYEFNDRADQILELGDYYYLIGHRANNNEQSSDVLLIKRKKT